MRSSERDGNLLWLDNLRVTSTVCVILLHVSAPLVSKFAKIPYSVWWPANIIDGGIRFCVPVFVMITGALLLRREEDHIHFLKRRLFRVVLPFLFWTAIYIEFDIWLFKRKLSAFEVAGHSVAKLVNGASYHLWYIYMILGLYLFIPMIGRWIRRASEKEILYFLAVWGISLLLWPQLPKMNSKLMYFSEYIGYLVLGYYLSVRSIENSTRSLAIWLGVLTVVSSITIFGTYLVSNTQHLFSPIFYSYLSLNVAVAAGTVFLLFRCTRVQNPVISSIRNFISRYSYGIYLAHVVVLFFLNKNGINGYWHGPAIGIPATALICLAISGTLIFLLNKLPYGKYIGG